MLFDLIRALLAAAVGVLPGWYWARTLSASADRAEQFALSVALSMTPVPAAALVPARLLGLGVTLPVTVLLRVVRAGDGLGRVPRLRAREGTR